MELPSDVLAMVKEYSMPITRPDWRKCGQIRKSVLKSDFQKITTKREIALLSSRYFNYHAIQSKNRVFDFLQYRSLFQRN